MAPKNKEIRSAVVVANSELDSPEMIVAGYALVFEQSAVICEYDGIQYKEIIDKDALVGADISDVPFKYNHSNDFLVLARTRNKTLELTTDNMGLKIRAILADVTAGRDLYKLIQRGDIDKMSFAFTVGNESYDSATHTRRILKIDKVYDVSAVDTPAYDGTSISARNYFATQIEGEKKAKEQIRRKKLLLMTY